MRLHLRFHPQAWINDYAVAVDPEGPTEFFVEFGGELPDDDSYESDEFRELDGAPNWMKLGQPYSLDCLEEDSDLRNVLDSVEDFIESNIDDVTSVQLIEGYGARLSAPGYMDCTPWTVFATEEEAEEYLREEYDVEEEETEDE